MEKLNAEKIGPFIEATSDYLGNFLIETDKSAIDVLQLLFAPLDQMKLNRIALAAACYHFSGRRYVPLIKTAGEYRATGNVSMRVNDNKVLIKPSGEDFWQIQTSDFILVDLEGRILEGTNKPSIETGMHVSIYKERPDINAIIHTHPVCTKLFANYFDKLVIEDPDQNIHYEVPVIPFYEPGSKELAVHTANALKVIDTNAVILKDHGLVSIGKTLTDAVNFTEEIENEARIEVHRLYRRNKLTVKEARQFLIVETER